MFVKSSEQTGFLVADGQPSEILLRTPHTGFCWIWFLFQQNSNHDVAGNKQRFAVCFSLGGSERS